MTTKNIEADAELFHDFLMEKIKDNSLESLEIDENDPSVRSEFWLWKLARFNPERVSWKWKNGKRFFTLYPPKR